MKTLSYLLLALSACSFSLQARKQTEHTISQEVVHDALADLADKQPAKEAEKLPAASVDLTQVNSSTEKPSIGFGALEKGIAKVEAELVSLRETLADLKAAAHEHGREERAKLVRANEELVILKQENTQVKNDLMRVLHDQAAAVAPVIDGTEDDEDFVEEEDDAQTQDVVAIIANDGDEDDA
jgi:hypothetical protein